MDDSHVYGRLAGKFVAVVLGARAGRDDRTPRLGTPINHRGRRQVSGVPRRRTSDDERQCDEKWQNWYFFETE